MKKIIIATIAVLMLPVLSMFSASAADAKTLELEKAVIISQNEIALKFSAPVTVDKSVDTAPHLRLYGDGVLIMNRNEAGESIISFIESEQMQTYARNIRQYEKDPSVVIVKFSDEDGSDSMNQNIVDMYNIGYDVIVWMHGKDAYSLASDSSVKLSNDTVDVTLDYAWLSKLDAGTADELGYELPRAGSKLE